MILLTSSAGCRRQPVYAETALAEPIPVFNLLLTDGMTRINTGAIPPGSPVVLMLFSPECSYCAAQIGGIASNMSTLTSIRFYFITPFPVAGLRQFSREYRLDKYTNVVVGMDYDNFYLLHTRTNVIPFTAIYDVHNRLKKVLAGQADVHAIREVVYQ